MKGKIVADNYIQNLCNEISNLLDKVKNLMSINAGFELMDHKSRFTIHLYYFMEHFLLFFMKFGNQFLKAHHSFNLVVEYCFMLVILTTARTLYLFTGMFFTWHSLVKYLYTFIMLNCLITDHK